MAKFSNSNITYMKVPLSSLVDTGNVRIKYDDDDINQLAQSILKNGLLNPITTKPGIEGNDGVKTYEIIAGHRRRLALLKLCEQGHDFNLVEICIRTGDTWTLQMIENIQRTDLSPQEKESAIQSMLENGFTQTQIAERISKPVSYVSDIIAGTHVRDVAQAAGVDTDKITTRALAQLRSVEEESLPAAVKKLSSSGGTNKAATEILHEYKKRPEQKKESKGLKNPTSKIIQNYWMVFCRMHKEQTAFNFYQYILEKLEGTED